MLTQGGLPLYQTLFHKRDLAVALPVSQATLCCPKPDPPKLSPSQAPTILPKLNQTLIYLQTIIDSARPHNHQSSQYYKTNESPGGDVRGLGGVGDNVPHN